MNDTPGPASGLRRGFKQTHLPTGLHRVHRRRQARPTRADDGDALQKRPSACIFQASQSLRTGVSDTRWVSTGKRAA